MHFKGYQSNEVNVLIENTQIWKKFDLMCTRVQRRETFSMAVLNECSIIFATSILLKNGGCPGYQGLPETRTS